MNCWINMIPRPEILSAVAEDGIIGGVGVGIARRSLLVLVARCERDGTVCATIVHSEAGRAGKAAATLPRPGTLNDVVGASWRTSAAGLWFCVLRASVCFSSLCFCQVVGFGGSEWCGAARRSDRQADGAERQKTASPAPSANRGRWRRPKIESLPIIDKRLFALRKTYAVVKREPWLVCEGKEYSARRRKGSQSNCTALFRLARAIAPLVA